MPTLERLRVPEPEQVQEALAMMLGREVVVTDAGASPPVGAIPVAVAPLVADDVLAGCVWVDLGLGAGLGAAMSMVDAADAEACRMSGLLPPEYVAMVREIAAVLTGLFGGGDGSAAPTVRDLELLETGLADDTSALLADPRQAGFYPVQIPGYTDGLIGLALA